MANTGNKLTIGTIAANGLILIGAGHGVGPLFLIEGLFIMSGFGGSKESTFSMSGNYESTFMACCIFSIIGSLILFLSLFNVSRVLRMPGIILLWVGFAYLTHGVLQDDSLAWFSFWTGLPFLICSIILFVKTILGYKEPSAE